MTEAPRDVVIDDDFPFECPSCKEAGESTILSTKTAKTRRPGSRVSKYIGIRCPRCGKYCSFEATWTAKPDRES